MWAIKKDWFNLTSVANAFLVASVAAIATLPSGSLAGFPVKYALFFLILIYLLLTGGRYPIKFVSSVLGVGLFFLIYAVYGLADFGVYAITELILALGAILLGLLVSHIFACKPKLGRLGLLDVYKLSVMVLVFLKAVILAVYFASPSYDDFLSEFVVAYQEVTGGSFVTMPLPLGLVRIYMQNDLVAALFPLAVVSIKSRHEFTRSDRMIVLLAAVVVFLGFSRFNMAAYAVCLGFFLKADRRDLFMKLFLFVAVMSLFVVFFNEMMRFFELRFLSEQNAISDEVRFNQAAALMDLFFQSPLVGHGLGAYTEEVIRSVAAPFSYEQQLLSFLPKFGLLGALVVLCYVGYIFFVLMLRRQRHAAALVALFVFSSFFNPYLFSSNMVLMYAVIYYIFIYAGRDDRYSIPRDARGIKMGHAKLD